MIFFTRRDPQTFSWQISLTFLKVKLPRQNRTKNNEVLLVIHDIVFSKNEKVAMLYNLSENKRVIQIIAMHFRL